MITALHQVFGRKYGGNVASIPFSNITFSQLFFSTRSGNCVINWGDGTTQNFTPSKNIDVINSLPIDAYHTYSTAYTGNIDITFNNGLADVYSLFLNIPQNNTQSNTYNIQDFNIFINQFSNLYSLRISNYLVFASTQKCNIKGNIADVPNSVERIELGHMGALVNPNDLYLDVTNFKVGSQLKWLNRNMASAGGGLVTTWQTYGNLAKLPSQLYYFKLAGNAGTFTYSGTKVWASSFDTLDIGNASLSTAETDNLLIDMANSITTAIGGKVIRLANSIRTTASNSAVSYLQSLGFTITVLGVAAPANSKILDLPLQNSFTDTTGFNTMIAGGTSNLPTFVLDGSEYYANFNGSQSIKTNGSLIINNDKVSISFWLKTAQTTTSIITELSTNFENNGFLVANQSSVIQCINKNQGYNGREFTKSTSTFKHYVFVFDRSQNNINEIKIYIDGTLITSTLYNSADNSGNFGLFPLFIGQRAGNSLGFNGQIKLFKVFNYPLSTTEITNLYNKTM